LAISETFSLNKIGDFDSNYIAAGKIMTPRKIAIFCRRKWIDSPKILIVTFAKPATTVLMGGVLVFLFFEGCWFFCFLRGVGC
jgi:hypothetical protein